MEQKAIRLELIKAAKQALELLTPEEFEIVLESFSNHCPEFQDEETEFASASQKA